MDEVKQLFSGQAEQTQDPEQVPLASKAIWSLYPRRNKIGLSFPLRSALCAADAWFLSPVWRSERGSCSKQILIHSGRDLSLSVVFTDLPLALFSASGGKRFPLLSEGHEWLLCWWVFMLGRSGLWVPTPKTQDCHYPSLSYHVVVMCSLNTIGV